MTEIQKTNIAVANFIIDELYKEKPFNLVLDAGETGALYHIAAESHHLESKVVDSIAVTTWARSKNGTGCQLVIDEKNADLIYHMLSSYIAKHQKPENCIDQFIASGEFDKAFKDVFGLPESVVKSLKEVS